MTDDGKTSTRGPSGEILTATGSPRTPQPDGSPQEYFVVANSFAAPFVSDQSTHFSSGDSPKAALVNFVGTYRHPAGLYAAVAYASADAYHKGAKPLAQWLCNHEQAKRRLTAGTSGFSYLGHAPGSFEINGKAHTVEHPKQGSVVYGE